MSKTPEQLLLTSLKQYRDFAIGEMKDWGIEIGSKEYKANKNIKIYRALLDEWESDYFSEDPRNRTVFAQREILYVIFLYELCESQIKDMERLIKLKKNVPLKLMAGMLCGQVHIEKLFHALGLGIVKAGAISESQRNRRRGKKDANEKLVQEAAKSILDDNKQRTAYIYTGGKLDGKIKIRSLAQSLAGTLPFKQRAIEDHLRKLVHENMLL